MASSSSPSIASEHFCRYEDYEKAVYSKSQPAPEIRLSAPRDDQASAEITISNGGDQSTTTANEPTIYSSSTFGGYTQVESDSEHVTPKPRPRVLRRRSTEGSAQHGRPPRSETRDSSDAKTMTLTINEEADGYASEADMSGLDDYYISNPTVPDRMLAGKAGKKSSRGGNRHSTQPQRQGADSSCTDDECAWGEKPEVYDSDLESVVLDVGKAAHEKKMRRWKALAKDKFEQMLLDCIVNTESIPEKYANMHIDAKVINRLERVTKLSLTREKAFGHGVLAGNKVTGAVLWGPPGTGKTLLAKGVARESGFNMILASTADLWQKCHGEDEKVIKALFSMARKLHPTIVFIDEADAMLGSRKAGEKRHIRAMLNQFLMEWDGMTSTSNSPFILLATNRPMDLDPAVLRRAPIRIHLDVPTSAQRLGILSLLLKGEKLASDVTLERLAKVTQRYTGSDLKNLCVTAATECVGEQEVDTVDRILRLCHFQSAMVTVKATSWNKTMENDLNSFGQNVSSTQGRQEDN